MSSNQNNQSRRSKRGKAKKKPTRTLNFKKILLALFVIALTILLSLGGIGYYWASTAPEIAEEDLKGTVASVIFDKDGNEIYETSSNERIIVDEGDISQQTFDAVISIEDQRFLEHSGFDPIRIIASALANVQAGGIVQGGSTLTQQLVKLSVFSTHEEDQTYQRKVQEIAIALNLEKTYSKQEIFEFYINKVYMANGVYGMGTAAEIYYGKPLKDLTLAQTALLAGMPQAPNSYDPYADPAAAQERRDLVLATMLDNEKISQEEYAAAIATPIDDGLLPIDERVEAENETNQVVDAYIQQVAHDIDIAGYDMYADGLKIYTHLDLEAQNHIYETVNDETGAYFPDEEMQAAVSVVDTETGHIIALFGGRNQEEALSLNRATTLDRSVGSSIKPFSAYAPAIEYLNLSTGSSVKDEEYEYDSGDEINNYDYQYMGWMTLRKALIESRNIPALKLFHEVGAEKVDTFFKNVGIEFNDGVGAYESNAIGGEATPLEMSAAYAALGNYGEYNEPKAVDYFITTEEETIEVSGDSRQAMRESTAYMVTDMLKDSFTDGILSKYANPNLAEAGKSGTTNYTEKELAQFGMPDEAAPDHWLNGYTTNYALSIWTGYDQQMSETGYLTFADTQVANWLYRDIMDFLATKGETSDWVRPDTVHELDLVFGVIPTTVASAQTPASQIVRNELVNENLFKELQKQIDESRAAENSRRSRASSQTPAPPVPTPESSSLQPSAPEASTPPESSSETSVSSEEPASSESLEEAVESEESAPESAEGQEPEPEDNSEAIPSDSEAGDSSQLPAASSDEGAAPPIETEPSAPPASEPTE